ncbi:MAG: methyltransferase [Candidatus Taylorbacteria bacterium]|nr:methyltransferase [Candidatus Taylorbacteria bacterium]
MPNLYNKYILPRLLNRDMRSTEFNETRSKTVSPAQGIVLEIGFGSGFNLPFYKNTTKLYALDPSRELFEYAKDRIKSSPFPVEYLQHSAENIPLQDNSIDAVVSTWTLCSIPDLTKALKEVRRVLKPGGKFLFVEHGRSPKKLNLILQTLVTPITKLYAGNCHLDRKIDDEIKNSGLRIETIEMSSEDGRPLMYSYRGIAIQD